MCTYPNAHAWVRRVSKDIIAWRHALVDTDGPRTFTLHANKEGGMYIKGGCLCVL